MEAEGAGIVLGSNAHSEQETLQDAGSGIGQAEPEVDSQNTRQAA